MVDYFEMQWFVNSFYKLKKITLRVVALKILLSVIVIIVSSRSLFFFFVYISFKTIARKLI